MAQYNEKPADQGAHAPSSAGDPAHMPDGCVAQINTLATPGAVPFGQYKDGSAFPSRQDIPVNGIGVAEAPGFNGFQSGGEPGLLGQDTDDYNSTLHDANYPSTPNPEYTGAAGTTNMGPQGDQLAWDSVGKYRYPDLIQSPSPWKASGGRARVQGP